MKIMVTGGAGFIGYHLCRRHLLNGDEVVCVDNLSSGRRENVEELKQFPGFSFIEADVIDLPKVPVDRIYNLACPASPPYYQKDPIHTAMTCVLGAKNVLDLADECGAVVLQASTSEVYGEPLIHPQMESYRGNVNPHGIRSCYDEGKRMAETLFFDYNRMHGTKIKVVRIFNTYGPYMDRNDGRVVSNFINQAIRDLPITLYGDGGQTRSFCYVSDTVEAIVRMMESGEDFLGPVNIGNPAEITVRRLAEMVKERTGSASELCFCELPQDDPTRRRPDITLAKEKLDWAPAVPIEKGLDETVAYFRRIRE